MIVKALTKDIENIENCGRISLPIFYKKTMLEDMIKDENFIIYVSYKDNIFQGYIIAEKGNNCLNIHINSLAVLPEQREKNVGTQLISKIKNLSKYYISLNVQASNLKAIRFYRNHGFFKVKELKNYYSDLNCNNAFHMLYFPLSYFKD